MDLMDVIRNYKLDSLNIRKINQISYFPLLLLRFPLRNITTFEYVIYGRSFFLVKIYILAVCLFSWKFLENLIKLKAIKNLLRIYRDKKAFFNGVL
jgi:hypothetical protein